MSRGLKFRIYEVEGLCYQCSENKGADQLRGTAKLFCVSVFAYAKTWFSHNKAHRIIVSGEFYKSSFLISECSLANLDLDYSYLHLLI